jgi:acetolactate synthase regulatory subunit
VIILPIQCASSITLSRFLRVVYRREFLCRTRILVISTPRWGHFRSHQAVGDLTYEFLVVILLIQCASSSTLSRFLRVVYRREFLYRTGVFVISTPLWGHFRSHQVVGDVTYEFLVLILPIHCASSNTLSRFLKVVYRRQFLYIVGLSEFHTKWP